MNIGLFINTIVHFIIITLAIFISIWQINRIRRTLLTIQLPKECPFCVSQLPKRALKYPNCASDLTRSVPPVDRKVR